jgi:hypothetical protein
MASQISGVYLTVTAVGAVLVWSGWKGTTLTGTFTSLFNGNLNAPATEASSPEGNGVSSAGDVSGSDSQNYVTIANFLVGNGYSKVAAAGICGCIAGESSANPEAVGAGSYGLIQEQGSQYAGLVTGNASADLDTQLQAILTYNNAQGQGLIDMLNAQTDPVQAADFYSQYFERPRVADSDVVPSVATSVYAQITNPTLTDTPTG